MNDELTLLGAYALMNSLILLVSPPASGKTYWISQYQKVIDQKILFLSPLRALADECKLNWSDSIEVRTPEEWIGRPVKSDVVIIDEYHLYFYWGDSFRPLMWEVFFEVISEASLVVLLTATLSEEIKNESLKWSHLFNRFYLCDFGNQKLKFKPKKYIVAPHLKWIENLVLLGVRGRGVNLIFCQYRDEVEIWVKKLEKAQYRAWGFVGGEAGEVALKMKSEKYPDFIVATTVLSHGVNLPEITCVYFTYKLKNVDFWVQMVARGGRKGEIFEVFSLEPPHDIFWSRWKNQILVLMLGLKINLQLELKEFSQWLLRE